MYIIRRINDNWEQLINDKGIIIAENHRLDVVDVLEALKIKFKREEIWTDE